MDWKEYEQRLSDGHANSLGNTVEVTEEVLYNPARFDALFHCYFSSDEVVPFRLIKGTPELRDFMPPHLERLAGNERKSVSRKTSKTMESWK